MYAMLLRSKLGSRDNKQQAKLEGDTSDFCKRVPRMLSTTGTTYTQTTSCDRQR